MDELLQSAAWAVGALTESDALWRLVGVAVRGTLLLTAALLIAHALRGASAAVRHLVWSGALGGVLVLLAAAFTMPAWELPILPPVARTADVRALAGTPVALAPAEPLAPMEPTQPLEPMEPEAAVAAAAAAPATFDVASSLGSAASARDRLRALWPPRPAVLLWLAYALGVALVLARLLVGSLGVHRLARRAEPVLDAEWHLLVQRLARQLGVRRPVTLLLSEWRTVPVTWGVVYPVVLLPSDAMRWSAERRRLVLLHELAHVARLDAFTHVVTQLAAAALWFNPLVWVAVRRMRAECERACDDVVLAAGERPSQYADDLLDIARTLQHAGGPAFAAWAMARRTEIEGRLLAILDPEVKRARASRRGAVAAAALASVVALPLAVVQPSRAEAAATPVLAGVPAPGVVTAPEPGESADATPAPAREVAAERAALAVAAEPAVAAVPAVGVVPAAAARPAVAARTEDCGSGSMRMRSWRGMLHNTTDNSTTIAISDDTSCVEVRIVGDVEFSEDERDVVRVGRDGLFAASERKRGLEREIVIRPGDGGALVRRYQVDGDERDAREASAWLAQLLPSVLRESAVNAKQRVARARRAGGIAGALALIKATHSDGAKRIYFEELVAGGATPDTLRLLAELAARSMSSDGDKSAVLRRLTSARRGDVALGSAVVAASRTISSDGDKRSVLQAVLAESGSGMPLTEMSRAVEEISSDGDKAAVLMEMPRRSRADETSRRAYFSAVNTISSDGDRRRVLTKLLEDSLDTPTLVAVLDAARDISSDGDKSAVLAAVARRYALDGDPVRKAFFGAARTVSSDSDRRGVLQAALARRPLTSPVMLDLLGTAEEISSDHDKSSVLMEVVGRPELRDQTVRARFFEVLKTVSSSSDYRRVMEAVVQI